MKGDYEMKYQQGDLIIKLTNRVPSDAVKVLEGPRGFVLAEGEATGHAHVIEERIEMYEKDGVLYLIVDKSVTVKHEEHNPINLDRGIYKLNIVREYDPFEEEVRKVAD